MEVADSVRVDSIAKTMGDRDVFAITLGLGEVDRKPAILIVGNVHAPHIAGRELALRLAEQLVREMNSSRVAAAPVQDREAGGQSRASLAQDIQGARSLLERFTIYVIPCPSPDATEKAFVTPGREVTGNARKTDDDRDGEASEDAPEDLDGDGWITRMRVHRPGGEYRDHPDDPRLMVKADPRKDKPGAYDVYLEGKDNDDDESWNEDAGDGVNFNANFTHNYAAFAKQTGPNPVSEIESRAVADFAFDHPNIALVLTFTPDDNLFKPWKADAKSDGARIKKTIHSRDAPFLEHLAEAYRKIHGGKKAPSPPPGKGSFAHWAYFHFGRWSLATPGWFVPETQSDAKSGVIKKPVDTSYPADDRKRANETASGQPVSPETVDVPSEVEDNETTDTPAGNQEGGSTPPRGAGPKANRESRIARTRRRHPSPGRTTPS